MSMGSSRLVAADGLSLSVISERGHIRSDAADRSDERNHLVSEPVGPQRAAS
eukprot:COSAG04_NODE_683_length_11182_cov_15.270775_8_plen_52_part_00